MAATKYHIENHTLSLKNLAYNALLPTLREKPCCFKSQDEPFPSVIEEMLLSQLLFCAGFGRRREAESIYKEYSVLLLRCGRLLDIAKNNYENITAFEYAVKAKDSHFVRMVVEFIETYQGKDRNEIAANLLTQFERTFSNERLASVNRYIEACIAWRAAYSNRSLLENDKHFAQDVSASQADFEAHILQEYSLTGH